MNTLNMKYIKNMFKIEQLMFIYEQAKHISGHSRPPN
jgi:hypothetical protein